MHLTLKPVTWDYTNIEIQRKADGSTNVIKISCVLTLKKIRKINKKLIYA